MKTENSGTVTSRIGLLSIPFMLGFFLVGTTGFDLLPNLGVFNGKRIVELVILLLIPLAALASRTGRDAFESQLATIPTWLWVGLAAVFAIGIVSALRFDPPAYGLLEMALPAMLIIALIATAASRRMTGESFDRLGILIIVAMTIMVVVTEAMGMAVAWAQGLEFSSKRMLIRFSTPRFYNQLQTYCIPLAITLPFIFHTRNFLKPAAVALLGCLWCLVFISGGRGTIVAVLSAMAVTALVFPAVRRAWLGWHGLGVILGMLLFIGVNEIQSVDDTGDNRLLKESVGRPLLSSSGRNDMWARSVEQARHSPILGSGPGRFSCGTPLTLPSHPHNFLMRILSEMGWIAFFGVIVICNWLGWRLFHQSRKRMADDDPQPVLTAMLFCSVLAGAIHAFVSGVLIMPAGQVMTILVCAWCMGRFSVPETARGKSPSTAVAVLVAGLLLAGTVTAFSISEVGQMNERTRDLRKTTYYMPRYWHYGRSCNYTYENK